MLPHPCPLLRSLLLATVRDKIVSTGEFWSNPVQSLLQQDCLQADFSALIPKRIAISQGSDYIQLESILSSPFTCN